MSASSEQFIDAYARCEKYLRRVVGADRGVPFGHLVREAARRDRAVRRFRDDLLEYAELRNAIVHQRVDGQPIADPHPKVAAHFEHIADLLDRPPRIADRFLRHVASIEPATSLTDALAKMRSGDYSVLPVYERGRFIGLLTASGIARWLSQQAGASPPDLARAVTEVLAATKHADDKVRFVAQNATVLDVLDEYQRAIERGAKLDAVIVTQHGQPHEAPLGIATPADIPELLDLLNGNTK